MKLRRTLGLALAPVVATAAFLFPSAAPAMAATCTTSAQFGVCNYSPYRANQDEWNPTTGSSQTLTATSKDNWSVRTNQPGGAYVRTYPDISQNLDGKPISKFTGLSQTFTQNPQMTSGTWESATDVWLNGAPGTSNYGPNTVEIMTWTNNHGNHPAGANVGTATIYKQNFTAWVCTGTCVQNSGIRHPYFAFVLQGTENSGTVHDLSTFRWLINHGYISSSLPVTQVDYGMEAGNINPSTTTAGTYSVSQYFNTVGETA